MTVSLVFNQPGHVVRTFGYEVRKSGREFNFPGIYNVSTKATELPESPRACQFVMLPIAFNIRTFFYCSAHP